MEQHKEENSIILNNSNETNSKSLKKNSNYLLIPEMEPDFGKSKCKSADTSFIGSERSDSIIASDAASLAISNHHIAAEIKKLDPTKVDHSLLPFKKMSKKRIKELKKKAKKDAKKLKTQKKNPGFFSRMCNCFSSVKEGRIFRMRKKGNSNSQILDIIENLHIKYDKTLASYLWDRKTHYPQESRLKKGNLSYYLPQIT